jgi:tripartite-type tricarboxylate transporter receptor subunit TctC
MNGAPAPRFGAPPDGYNLLMSSNVALATNRHLYKRLGFDPDTDFAPISVVATAGPVLVVHPAVPARTVKELIALARARSSSPRPASTSSTCRTKAASSR